MSHIFSLEGKRILITGASSGIGKAVAQQCATAGATCIITARHCERLKDTLNTLPGDGHEMIISDLTSLSDIDSLVSKVGRLDGIVCCAGIVEPKLFKFTDEEDLTSIFNINTYSNIRLLRSLVQEKKFNKKASVIIISSISGVKCGYIGGAIYGASKGAVEGFVKALAIELSSRKIRVNTITPGMIETPLLNNSEIGEDLINADIQRYPLKRYGKPEEVGYAAVYLLSDATEWITGTSLLIDGGYTLN